MDIIKRMKFRSFWVEGAFKIDQKNHPRVAFFLYLILPFRQGDFAAIEPDFFLIVQVDQELAGIRDVFGEALIGLLILLKSDRSS